MAMTLKAPKTVVHTPNVPSVVQAAQIAIVTMKLAKVNRWEELQARDVAELRSIIRWDPEQLELLQKHSSILRVLQVSPAVTVYACPACERFGFTGPGAKTGKCVFTEGCDGSLVRASTMNFKPPAKKPKPSSSST